MGGIIRGFLGGAGAAAAKYGEMRLNQQMLQERDEAQFLRDKELAGMERKYRTGEREASQRYQTSAAAIANDNRVKAAATTNTNAVKAAATANTNAVKAAKTKTEAESKLQTQKDAAALERTNVTAASKGKKNPMTIKYTDSKGNPQEAVLRFHEDGSSYLEYPDTGEVALDNIVPTTEDVAQAAKEYDSRAEALKSDQSQFGMSEKQWRKKRAVEIAVERMHQGEGKSEKIVPAPQEKSGAGIVDSQANAKPVEPEKKIGRRSLSKAQYVTLMKNRYPEASDAELGKMWDAK